MYYKPLDGSNPIPIAIGPEGPMGPEGPIGPIGPGGSGVHVGPDAPTGGENLWIKTLPPAGGGQLASTWKVPVGSSTFFTPAPTLTGVPVDIPIPLTDPVTVGWEAAAGSVPNIFAYAYYLTHASIEPIGEGELEVGDLVSFKFKASVYVDKPVENMPPDWSTRTCTVLINILGDNTIGIGAVEVDVASPAQGQNLGNGWVSPDTAQVSGSNWVTLTLRTEVDIESATWPLEFDFEFAARDYVVTALPLRSYPQGYVNWGPFSGNPAGANANLVKCDFTITELEFSKAVPVEVEMYYLDPDTDTWTLYSASGGGGGLPEIEIGDTEPTEQNIQLYINPDGLPTPPDLTDLDDRYVNADGDTMTGKLAIAVPQGQFSLSVAQGANEYEINPDADGLAMMNKNGAGYAKTYVGTPTHASHAASKGYVDGRAPVNPVSFVPKIYQGGTLITNGTVYRAHYYRVGDMVYFEIAMLMSNSGKTGTVEMDPPVTITAGSGSGFYMGSASFQIGTQIPCMFYRAAGTAPKLQFARLTDASLIADQLTGSSVLRGTCTYLVS